MFWFQKTVKTKKRMLGIPGRAQVGPGRISQLVFCFYSFYSFYNFFSSLPMRFALLFRYKTKKRIGFGAF